MKEKSWTFFVGVRNNIPTISYDRRSVVNAGVFRWSNQLSIPSHNTLVSLRKEVFLLSMETK